MADLYDRLLAEARGGCWCGDRRKPCSYHEGYAGGLEVMETALAAATATDVPADEVERWVHNDSRRDGSHPATPPWDGPARCNLCGHSIRMIRPVPTATAGPVSAAPTEETS